MSWQPSNSRSGRTCTAELAIAAATAATIDVPDAAVVAVVVVVVVVVDVCCWVGVSFFSGVHDSGGAAADPLPAPAEESPAAADGSEDSTAAGGDLGLMRIT